MANDLFGGLGGFMKGLSSFMPQDDPNVQLLNAQTELSDLIKREAELYAQIGKRAMEVDPGRYVEFGDQLRLVQSNIAAAQSKLNQLKNEKEAKEKAEKEERDNRTCPECGHENPEGVKFCQECGTKVGGTEKCFCGACGAENPRGTKFCGECGNKLL